MAQNYVTLERMTESVEGAYDESTQQERIVRNDPPTQWSKRTDKAWILDEFVQATGYHRNYSIRVLSHSPKPKSLKEKGRQKFYQSEVAQVLTQIWKICERICSKQLWSFLPEITTIRNRHQEISLSADNDALLLGMRRSTIDRRLKTIQFERRCGLSNTKPGTMLKKAFPILTITTWKDERVGFLEINLVAHCGDTTEGQYLHTLTAIDIATGWTDWRALPNNTQRAVSTAIEKLGQQLPFALLGLNSDNGGEFINDSLLRYCRGHKITFIRSRPYRKNDEVHVE